ncbi:hypothetical protein QUF63_04700 [Anaerolineales bacterium HSG25]|nr:hypothetical protein [Anaerolineales bacterium HSG25]
MIFIIASAILLGFICLGVAGVAFSLAIKQADTSAQDVAEVQPTQVVEPPTPTLTFTPVPPAHTPTLEPTPIPTQVVLPTTTNTPVAVNQADVVASTSDDPPPPENGDDLELPVTNEATEITDIPSPSDVVPTDAEEEPLSEAMPKSGGVILSGNSYIAVVSGVLVLLLLIMIGITTRLQRLNDRA